MPNNAAGLLKDCSRAPWNKGKLIGAKPPLQPKHVWSIRTRLMIAGRARDLAMFNLAIDSKLRGCDLVALRVAPNGYTVERATVRQRKTGRPVKFELTEQTRQAIEDYLQASGKKPGEFLFASRRQGGRCMTTRQYARLVAEWIGGIGLDPRLFGTHSLRRTKADLPAHGQPPGRATPARPYEDREYGPISRDRGRRRAGNSGTS
jgi:integrase